jgi:thiol-disulfide isomerase/thioredoxin
MLNLFIKYFVLIFATFFYTVSKAQNETKIHLSYKETNDKTVVTRTSEKAKLEEYTSEFILPVDVINYKIFKLEPGRAPKSFAPSQKKVYLDSCFINILLIIRNNNRSFILDLNNNKNFTDDIVISDSFIMRNQRRDINDLTYFKTTNTKKYNDLKKIFENYQYKFYLLLNIFDNSPAIDFFSFLDAEFIRESYKTVTFEKNYYFEFGSWMYNDFNNDFPLVMLKNNQDSTLFKPQFKESFLVGDKVFVIDSFDIENKKVLISNLGLNKNKGINVGLYPPFIKGIDYRSKKTILINGFKNKNYHILDFWGTWCGPCKELTPNLIQLKKRNDSLKLPINHISVANDKSIEDVKSYISETKFNWTTVFDDRTKMEISIAKTFNVVSFPTFLIIDKAGKIIFRDIGIPGFYKMEEFIQKKKVW